jgi:hypothetical protein
MVVSCESSAADYTKKLRLGSLGSDVGSRMRNSLYRILAVIFVTVSGVALAAEGPQYIGMPKLVLEQLCEKNDPGCRFFIGGVADTLFYAAKGTICFPMKETNGLKSIDLDRVVETSKNAMSALAFDQDMAAALFIVWRTAYPCQN